MAEKQFADKHSRPIDTHITAYKGRSGFEIDPQPTAQAFALYVESMDARRCCALPWALYAGYEWSSDGDCEVLTILFSNRVVTVKGYSMARGLRAISQCRLVGIRHQNERERLETREWNKTAQPDKIEAEIVNVTVEPEDFQQVVNATLNRMEPQDEHGEFEQR